MPTSRRRLPLAEQTGRWRQFFFLVGLYVVFTVLYEFGRYLARAGSEVPLRHARDVISIERTLGLFIEPRLQDWMVPHSALSAVTAWVYTYGHHIGSGHIPRSVLGCTPGTISLPLAMVLGQPCRRRGRVLAIPLAPPRLVPELGLADPAGAGLPAAPGAATFAEVRNEFAAMPSLHVGYPLLFSAMLSLSWPRSLLAWTAWLWPAAVAFAVMATANHYWLDGAGARSLSGWRSS